jgi:hypothetical protein
MFSNVQQDKPADKPAVPKSIFGKYLLPKSFKQSLL